MRTETIKLFSFDELRETAKENAVEQYRQNNYDPCDYLVDEFAEALRIVKDVIGNPPTNDYTGEELTGLRAYKWVVNRLGVRMEPATWIERNGEMRQLKRPSNVFEWEVVDFDGMHTSYLALTDAKECFLNWSEGSRPYSTGNTVSDYLESIADVYTTALEREREYQNSPEAIRERLSAEGREYTADGKEWEE